MALLPLSCPRPSKEGPQVELLRENGMSVQLGRLDCHSLAEQNLEGPLCVASRVEHMKEFLEELDMCHRSLEYTQIETGVVSCQERSEYGR